MNICFKLFKWTFQFSLSFRADLYRVIYRDGIVSQPMLYDSAVFPANLFGGKIVALDN